MRNRISGRTVIAVLILLNIAVWALAIILIQPFWPLFLSQCVVAYTFGLRHAIDADHIAAIDNVTRRLVEDWKVMKLNDIEIEETELTKDPPHLVGLFFSLGHSSVVIVAVIIILIVASSIAESSIENFAQSARIIGTSISIIVLFAMALVNGVSFHSLLKLLRNNTRYQGFSSETIEISPQETLIPSEPENNVDETDILSSFIANQKSGCLFRFIWPFIKTVDAPWKMFPVGFLFGIGFDTSTEIGLLALSASQTNLSNPNDPNSPALPIGYIMFLPILFTVGMCLIDTGDGVFMSHLYSWAYMNNPFRRIMFNLVITLTSVLFGLFVGVIQLMSLLAEQLELTGSFWKFWITVSESSEIIGGSMIVLFFVAWAMSYSVYRRCSI